MPPPQRGDSERAGGQREQSKVQRRLGHWLNSAPRYPHRKRADGQREEPKMRRLEERLVGTV